MPRRRAAFFDKNTLRWRDKRGRFIPKPKSAPAPKQFIGPFNLDRAGRPRDARGRFLPQARARLSSRIRRQLKERVAPGAVLLARWLHDEFGKLDTDGENRYPSEFIQGKTLAQAYANLSRMGDFIDPETRQVWSGERPDPEEVSNNTEVIMQLYDDNQGESLKYMYRASSQGRTCSEWSEYFLGGAWEQIMEEKVLPYWNIHSGNWRFVSVIFWRIAPGAVKTVKSVIEDTEAH